MRIQVKPFLKLVAFACFVTAVHAQSFDRAQFTTSLVNAAVDRSKVHVRYEPAYVRIAYPGGDVPSDTGVCSDEIVRIYRRVGIDLQRNVHEDMSAHFDAYPSKRMWGRSTPDSNIDHRRVPNLMTFFERNGQSLPLTRNSADYLPGDIVAWDLGHGQTHIGMVVDQKAFLSSRYKILHNIGRGPQIEDALFDWKIIGHYRYYGSTR
jgi:uncharacterized protein